MSRKLICLALAVMLALTCVLTGCSGGAGKDTTAATTAAATTAAATTAAATTAATTPATTAATTKVAGTTLAPATTATAAATDSLDEVTLTWYNASGAFRADQFPQKLEVGQWLSDYTHEKINAYIDYKWFDSADYNEKTSAAVAAGQPMDILYTSINRFNFGVWQKRGAFLDITDLIQEYAAETYASIPEWVWKAATVEGKLYAMPTYKDVAVTMGLIYNKTMLQDLGMEEELLGMDWSVAKQLDEFYYKVKEARDAHYGAEYAAVPLNQLRVDMHIYYEADNLGSIAYTSIPGTPSFTEAEFEEGKKVFNVYATQEYADAIAMVTRWVNDEIVPFDTANWDTEKEIQKSGKMFSKYTWGLVAVNEDEYFDAYGWKQGLMQPRVAFTYTGYPQAVMQAISATSENPERAMMLLNLVFSDQQFSTSLRFGIEGKGWNRVIDEFGNERADFTGTYNEDKQTRGDNGFYLWYHAEQGNLFTCLLPMEQDAKFFEYLDAMNKSAAASVNMGFVLDTAPIDTEIAACESVKSEFHDDLITGMETDYEARIQQFIEKLNANGAEKIIAESQAQLDAWRSAQ